MNGFIDIVNGFSQSAIDALKVKADELYVSSIDYVIVNVDSVSTLESAVSSATVPTRVVMASGNYGSATLSGNTAQVIVEAETDFLVYFQSALQITGDNITVQKCIFNGSGYAYVYGNDIKVIRNDFNASTANDWVKIATTAYRTEVGYNIFQNRNGSVTNGHQIIEQRVIDSTEKYETWVHHNHFKDISSSISGTELYLIYGQTDHADDTPVYEPTCPPNDMVFEYNLFEDATGDGKAIDMKTNGVTARYNTVMGGSQLSFIIRHGNYCNVYNNITVQDGSRGRVTMSGANNNVYNNILNSWSAVDGILLNSGTNLDHATVSYVSHMTIDNTLVAFNTIYGEDASSDGMMVGAATDLDGGQDWSYPPQNSIIAHNLMIGCRRSMYTGHIAVSDLISITYDNNHYVDGSTLSGDTGLNNDGNGSMASVLTNLPSYSGMNLADYFANGVLMPTAGSSILSKGTNSYPLVSVDAQLTVRPTSQSLGGSEMYSIGSSVDSVLTPADVGVDA